MELVKGEVVWLQEGIKMVSSHGLDGLNIDSLSLIVGKAKTSFYHYFKSKNGFIERLTLYWEYAYTEQVLSYVNSKADAQEKLNALINMTHDRMHEELIWVFLKQFNKATEEIQSIIDRVEQNRLAFLTTIFLNLGLDQNIAEKQAKVFMYLFFGWCVLHNASSNQMNKDEFKNLLFSQLLPEFNRS